MAMFNARVVFIATTAEEASLGMGKALLEFGKFEAVHCDLPYDVYRYEDCYFIWENQTLPHGETVDWEEYFDCECFVVLYRHSGRAGKKRLTVHPQGNFSLEPRAGKGRSLGAVHSIYMRHMFKTMVNVVAAADSDYLVNYEVTHHGPTYLKTPVMFVEVGDGEENWSDVSAHALIAESVLKFIEDTPESATSVLCMGGEHYADRFTRRMFSEGWALGHMVPARDFEHLDEGLIDEIVSKTVPEIKFVVWDKKKQGTLEQREFLLGYFEKKGMLVKKI